MAASVKSKVYFFYETPVSLIKRNKLKKFIERIFELEGRKLKSLNYIFCADSQILKINKRFLQHNYYTDIITFELSEKKSPVEGEIYISVDRIKENSKMLSETYKKELHRVIFHGALHLCGYNDKRKNENWKMRIMEEKYLRKYL